MVQDAKKRSTFWNDALPPAARVVVDTCLDRILTQDWQQRRATIETTVAAAEKTPSSPTTVNIATHQLAATIVAAIIERLETPEIVDLDQAELFAMSASPDHQIAACDWLIEAAVGNAGRPDTALGPVGMRVH
ncbi:MAG: hypothetical protein OXT06_01200 [Rhodospirillaceae bacterium]|nr:hypothetical protein [Rhodospirillaceae bacterium]